MKLYGIPNCDTVKKVRKALEKKDISYTFVDFKKSAPSKKLISMAQDFLGDLPVNKRGTTYRKIKEEFERASDAGKVKMLVENPSAIKRPILESEGIVLGIGFDENVLNGL